MQFGNEARFTRCRYSANIKSARSICQRATVSASAHSSSHSPGDSCVVVGGGVGGLVAAAKLQQQGYQVTVLEQNAQVGGRCQSVFQDGYRFDTGPSLLLFPNTYKQTFEWLGSNLGDHVQIAKVQEAAYRVFFADGASGSSSSGSGSSGGYLDLLYAVQAMVDQLEQEEPGADNSPQRQQTHKRKSKAKKSQKKPQASTSGIVLP